MGFGFRSSKLGGGLKVPWLNLGAIAAAALAIGLITAKNLDAGPGNELLNVSYDPTRELYQSLNAQFTANYAQTTGKHVRIKQSHGGSSRQARSVIEGQQAADVVTLGLFTDVDALRKHGLIAEGWENRLPHHSQPYFSTIVFVVRKGNPKHIHDWPDLITPGVSIITPDPRTSGNGKLSALAAFGATLAQGGSEAQARDYLKAFYEHVEVLDPAARTSATTFAVQNIGDVHVTWEDEALREVDESKGELAIVYPARSILAEPYVAWVDVNVSRDKTGATAKAYLDFLFTDEAQETIAKLGFRPVNAKILEKYSSRLPKLDLFPVTLLARDWEDTQYKFFDEHGIVDTVLKPAFP